MANFRIDSGNPKAFAATFSDARERMAKAATNAMNRVAADIKEQGRADIATAGFSKRWQDALSVRVYPEGKDAVDPACVVIHRIPYSSVFEGGAVIGGKPLLWIALPAAKKYVNSAGGHITPQRFLRAGYTLVSLIRRGNRLPLLAVATKRVSRGRGKRRLIEAVQHEPVFYGVQTVSIPKKFHIDEICRQAADKLTDYYEQALRNG